MPILFTIYIVVSTILLLLFVVQNIILRNKLKELRRNVDNNNETGEGVNDTEVARSDAGEKTQSLKHLQTPRIEYKSLDEQFLNNAIAIINKNLDNSEFSVNDLLAVMNMTNSTLYRKLKALTGLSPNEFIRSIRLKVAHEIITEKFESVTIAEIAYTVGFNIPKYFNTCFCKEYGYTPAQYREKLLESKGDRAKKEGKNEQ